MPNPPDLSDQLLDAIRPLQRRLNAERSLSMGKLGVLHHLRENGRATAGELAARIQVSPQATSLSTRELEELGLIERTRDEEDRRRIWFTLTDAGRDRYEQEHRAAHAWLSGAIESRLTAAEARKIAAAIPSLLKLTQEDADG